MGSTIASGQVFWCQCPSGQDFWQELLAKTSTGSILGVVLQGGDITFRQTRQTNSFIENSIEAGILLCGNGILHAMLVARAVTGLQRTSTNHSYSLPF
jgi:hypothetical protein